MGIGVSVFLIAVGAILAWGVNAAVPHANLFVIGIILMAVGALGLITSMVVWGPRRRRPVAGAYPADEVVERPVVRDRELY